MPYNIVRPSQNQDKNKLNHINIDNLDIVYRFVVDRPCLRYFHNDVKTLNRTAEYSVLAIQPRLLVKENKLVIRILGDDYQVVLYIGYLQFSPL